MNIFRIGTTDAGISAYGVNSQSNIKKDELISASSISMVRERLLSMPQGSWVFFDLDETLWTQVGISVKTEYRGGGMYCVGSTIYKLVEEETLTLISNLKNKGIHVLSLTKRGSKSSTRTETLEHLVKVQVIFSRIFPDSVTILKEDYKDTDAILEDGVIFASDFSKGSIILESLKKAAELKITLPSEIALIDDLDENICNAKEALEQALEYNIPFLGIHYTAAKHLPQEKEDAEEKTVAFRNLFLEMHRSLSNK